MTEEQLQVIKDRLAKATPGPWEAQKEGMTWDVSVKDNYLIIADDCSEADANLIAAAPTDIAALLTELAFKNAQVAELTEAIAFWEKKEIDRLKGLVKLYQGMLNK